MSRMAAKDRREALIAAAIRVMVRDGVAKTTTRAIVNEAGMALGVFHYCFDSREQLLQEVITRITDHNVAVARKAFAGAGDLNSMLTRSLATFWEGVEQEPGQHLVGYELAHYALRQEGFEEIARRQYAQYLEAHEVLLTEGASNAGIRWAEPIPVLARYLNAILDGLVLCWLVDRNSEQSREVLRLATDHLMTLALEPSKLRD